MFKITKNLSRLIVAVTLFGCVGISHQVTDRTSHELPKSVENIKRVIIVTLENGSPDKAFRQPYMNELAKRGAFFSHYHAITHPSQPNYIAMIAGSTMDVATDRNVTVRGQHLGDLLENAGKTWKVYAEDFPGNCFLGERSGPYARKHVPFISFRNIQSRPDRCRNIVAATEFADDVANGQLPTYSYYVPNLNNDGHDTGLFYADTWLRLTFGPILDNDELMKDTLVIITFDEDDRLHLNRIYTVFIGAAVQPGTFSSRHYDHYSMLKTIEDIFQLGNLGRHDASAETIWDIWQPKMLSNQNNL